MGKVKSDMGKVKSDMGEVKREKLPDGWQMIKIKHLVNLCTENSETNDNYIGMENVESWTGKIKETGFQPEGIALKVRKNDVLFGKLRPYLAKTCVVANDGCCSTEFLVMSAKHGVPAKFIMYTFLNPALIARLPPDRKYRVRSISLRSSFLTVPKRRETV